MTKKRRFAMTVVFGWSMGASSRIRKLSRTRKHAGMANKEVKVDSSSAS